MIENEEDFVHMSGSHRFEELLSKRESARANPLSQSTR